MIPSGMMRIQGVPICFESNSSVFHSLTVHFLVGQKNDEKFSLPYVTIVRFHSFVVQGHAKHFLSASFSCSRFYIFVFSSCCSSAIQSNWNNFILLEQFYSFGITLFFQPFKLFEPFEPFEPFSFKIFLDFHALKTFARTYSLKTFKLLTLLSKYVQISQL